MNPSDPRQRFFNETGDMIPPFVDPAWRGCLIDRDQYDHRNMPQMLFEAIIAAAAPTELHFISYVPPRPPEVLRASWAALHEHLLERWSLEFVLSVLPSNGPSWRTWMPPCLAPLLRWPTALTRIC